MSSDTLEDLAESFALFDDWEDRYRYIIDLGGRLPPMDDALKTESSEVKGCVSKVWMVPTFKDGRWNFIADSNGDITRGLLYLVLLAYNNKTSAEIAAYDIQHAFEALGLDRHLMPNRRNGFWAMVNKIKSTVSAAA